MQRRSFLITLFAIILPLIAAPLVLAFGPVAVTAAEPTPDVVTDWTELCAWLDAHQDVGGTVTLGADIEAAELEFSNNDFSQPITIDTGAYGLTAGSSLLTNYYDRNPNVITLMGEGVDRPVLSYMGEDDYSFGLYFFAVIAYGRDGQGGTAFRTNKGLHGFSMGRSSGIYAYGAGAVGLDCGGDADLAWLTVESDGLAIQAGGDIDLFGCHIIGELAGSEVTLDTCDAPDFPYATVLHRKVSAITDGLYFILGKPYAYQIAGQPVKEDWFVKSPLLSDNLDYTVMLSAEGAPDRYAAVYVVYDRVELDAQTIGAKTILPAHFLENFAGIDILPDDITLDLTVETIDGRLPRFTGNQSGWMFYDFYYLYAGDSLAPLTLWRSDDDGENWYQFWREDAPELTGATVDYYGETLTVQLPRIDFDAEEYLNQEPFLLAFETRGQSGGQVVYYNPSSGELNPDMGGDRDGGDRMVLPWEVFNGGAPGDAGAPGTTGHSGGVRPTGGGSGGSDGGSAPQQAPAPAGKDNPEHTGTVNQVENPMPVNNSDFEPDPSLPANNPPNPSGAPDLAAVSTLQSLSDHKNAEVITAQVTAVPIIEQPETEETAASALPDGQLSQAAQPADQSKDSANSFPVVPVVAGVVLVGGVGSVAYMYGKRRL